MSGAHVWTFWVKNRPEISGLYLDSRLHGNDNFIGNSKVANRGIFFDKKFAYLFINRNIAMKQ